MKILFFSPHALIDSSSGAALSVAALLAELTVLGHECVAVTGSVVDGQNQLFTKLYDLPVTGELKIGDSGITRHVRKVGYNGVTNLVTFFASNATKDVLAVEELALYQSFLSTFEQMQPDVLLTYGGFLSNHTACAFAKARNCLTVLYAASATISQPDHVAHVDRLVATSNSFAAQLKTFTDQPIETLSSLVRVSDVICEKRDPEFITFINPIPAKGLMLVAALVAESHRQNKPYKFLVVESRGTREEMFHLCPELSGLDNLRTAKNTSDVRLVYEKTAIVLFPSLWFETAGRVPLEANVNGIPVLASNIGGIPEMLDGAGYLFDVPKELQDAWTAPVPDTCVREWLDVIDRLHNDPTELAQAERRAKDAAGRYSLNGFAQKFADFVGR